MAKAVYQHINNPGRLLSPCGYVPPGAQPPFGPPRRRSFKHKKLSRVVNRSKRGHN